MNNTIYIGQGINTIGLMVRAFNLQNVQIQDVRKNQYDANELASGFQQPDQVRAAKMQGMGGVPVLVDLTLQGGTYKDNNGEDVTFPSFQFEAVIVAVDFAARVIKTEIQGRDGTVKEYIGQDDARVQIQGVIAGANGIYPINDVKALHDWCKAPVSKRAVSSWLNVYLGIYDLVVESWSFPQIAGGYSYQTFSIECISDIPVDLLIQ